MGSRGWRLISIAAALVFSVSVTACGGDDDSDDPPEEANPASVFCVEQGGEVDIVDEDDGAVGYCVLPDGTRVDEWEYFRSNADAADP